MHLEDLDEGPAWGAEFLCEDMGLRRCFASWHSVFHATLGTEAVSAFKAGLSPHFGEGKMGWELRGERIPVFFFFSILCDLYVEYRWTHLLFSKNNLSKMCFLLRRWSCLACPHLPWVAELGCQQWSACPRNHPELPIRGWGGGNEDSLSTGYPRSGLGLPLGVLL